MVALKGIAKHLLVLDALDHDFIATQTQGFTAFAADIAATPWEAIERESGLSRADLENVAQILAFLAPLPVDEVHLLPFHQYGEPKYALLDRAWSMAGIHAPEADEIAPIQTMVERAGYRVVIGG